MRKVFVWLHFHPSLSLPLPLSLSNDLPCLPHSHGLHGILDQLYPGVAFLFGASVHLHHLRPLNARRDQEQGLLLVGHLAHNQLLQGDHRRPLVLRERRQEQSVREKG